MKDPLCFGWLQPAANESFFAAASQLADPARLRQIRHDLPIYVFSGSDDPVGQQLEGVSVLIERYRSAEIQNISDDFYPGGPARNAQRDQSVMKSARICFGGSLEFFPKRLSLLLATFGRSSYYNSLTRRCGDRASQ